MELYLCVETEPREPAGTLRFMYFNTIVDANQMVSDGLRCSLGERSVQRISVEQWLAATSFPEKEKKH